MQSSEARNRRLYAMPFADVYPLYVRKVEKKGRSRQELDAVIRWLTGYDDKSLLSQIEKGVSLEDFFAQAPGISPEACGIKGLVCGVRVEEIRDPLMRQIRWLDKLVDELAKGRPIEKILRK